MSSFSILALVLAIAANVSANIFLKRAVSAVEGTGPSELVWGLLTSLSAWIGFLSAGLLLISYLAAIRSLPLGPAYAVVTALTIAILTAWDTLAGGESLDGVRTLGIAAIIVGFVLVVVSFGAGGTTAAGR